VPSLAIQVVVEWGDITWFDERELKCKEGIGLEFTLVPKM
jgi:hypothetical protein